MGCAIGAIGYRAVQPLGGFVFLFQLVMCLTASLRKVGVNVGKCWAVHPRNSATSALCSEYVFLEDLLSGLVGSEACFQPVSRRQRTLKDNEDHRLSSGNSSWKMVVRVRPGIFANLKSGLCSTNLFRNLLPRCWNWHVPLESSS